MNWSLKLIPIFVLFLVVHESIASYPTTKLQGLVGFAKKGGCTGGWGGEVIIINTFDELNQTIGDSTPRVLVINSDIKVSTLTKVRMGSNISIIGSFEHRTLYNIHFRDDPGSGNIIFQNLILQHSVEINGNDNIQINLKYGTKYWIDHCSFVGHYGQWSANDGSLDKLLYIGDKADYATVSNCYFGNHKYGVILGHPHDDDNAEYDGYPHLTICNNKFENLDVRAPGLMRYGYYHVYSNYIHNFNLGFTIATRAKILSENNYFDSSSGILDDKGNGMFTDSKTIQAITKQISPQCQWTASSQYEYKSISPEAAKQFANAYAGSQSTALVFVS